VCHFCSRDVKFYRIKGEFGYCRCGDSMEVSSIFGQLGEEPELVHREQIFRYSPPAIDSTDHVGAVRAGRRLDGQPHGEVLGRQPGEEAAVRRRRQERQSARQLVPQSRAAGGAVVAQAADALVGQRVAGERAAAVFVS